MVPDLAPHGKGGATWCLGAAILNKGRLTEPSDMVPPTQEENPCRNVCVHDLLMIGLELLGLGPMSLALA